jgi:hypothetical protein
MHKKLRITLLSVTVMSAALAASTPAWSWGGLTLPKQIAVDHVNTSAPPHAAPSVSAPGGLLQMGEPGPGSVGDAGYSNGVPLSMALGMLVPANWVGGTDGVSPSARVSWTGGQSWPQALGQIAKEKGWTILLDWGGHTVTVEGAPPHGTPHDGREAAHTAAVADAPPVYSLKAGLGLESQLQGWASRAGWKVVWNVPHDWIVPNGAVFGDDFHAAADQVIQTLAANGANVRADFYKGNRTLVVRAGSSVGEKH